MRVRHPRVSITIHSMRRRSSVCSACSHDGGLAVSSRRQEVHRVGKLGCICRSGAELAVPAGTLHIVACAAAPVPRLECAVSI